MYKEAILSYLTKNNYSKIDLKAVLFDMDGVLFDSMPTHAKAWTKTLQEKGLTFSEEECYIHEGRTGSDTINIIFNREFGRNATLEEIESLYKKKSDLFDISPKAPVMQGSLELLNKVCKNGLDRIIVTGSGQDALLSKLGHHFPGHFTKSKMVTAYDVIKGKPDPEPYLQGLRKAGIKAYNAIVVENAPLGIQASKAAGIFTIAINTGMLADCYLLDAGADLLFHGMPALNEAWPEVYEAFASTEIN